MTPPIPSRLSRLRSLRKRRGKASNPKPGASAPPTCPPADAEPGALAAARLYGRKPDGLWRYATAEDETAFYAARWNEADGKKTFRPISWRERGRLAIRGLAGSSPLVQLARSRLEAEGAGSHLRGREGGRSGGGDLSQAASPQRPAAALARRPRPIGRLSRAGRF